MCHQVTNKDEVATVNVRTVKLDESTKILRDGGAKGFDTENIEDFDTIVGVSHCEVHAIHRHGRVEVDATRLENPFLPRTRLDITPLVDYDPVAHQWETRLIPLKPQRETESRSVFSNWRENVFFYGTRLLVLLVHSTQHTTTNNQLLRVVFTPDDEEVRPETLSDPVGDEFNVQLVIDHLRTVELETEQPRRLKGNL